MVWLARYHVSRLLIWAGLLAMPPGAYRAELVRRVYDLKMEALRLAETKSI